MIYTLLYANTITKIGKTEKFKFSNSTLFNYIFSFIVTLCYFNSCQVCKLNNRNRLLVNYNYNDDDKTEIYIVSTTDGAESILSF